MCADRSGLAALQERMRAARLPAVLIEQFGAMYQRFRGGESGRLPWDAIEQLRATDIVERARLAEPANAQRGLATLDQLVCVRLNGGLATTMELDTVKSLIPVRDGRTFLDLIVEQTIALRARYSVRLPLLLMDSFRTREATLAALRDFDQPDGLRLDFLQHKFPRIDLATGGPILSPADAAAWAPPGHGDIYMAIWLGGLLRELADRGYRWAFVANADNLAATVDPAMLGFLVNEGVDFAMEVTEKTEADKKGGTLVRHRGRLTLLERAQVPDRHLHDFEHNHSFTVFNTNTVWWRIEAMLKRLENGGLDLPMIVNRKRVGQRDIVQLETAMGAAIGCFDRVVGIEVGRERFAPVKATNDLLVVRSDVYVVDSSRRLRVNPQRDRAIGPPVVSLDDAYYRSYEAFEQRFPAPLSMVGCRSLRVTGDVCFGTGVVVRGDVEVRNLSGRPARIDDGTELNDEVVDLH